MKLFDVYNEKYHMGHLIWDGLRTWPDAICQIDAATGDIETNASVLRRSVQLARCFLQFGIKPGDVLAIGGRNHINVHIPYYAGIMIGMPIAGVDPEFKCSEIKTHFKICSPRIAFCQRESLDAYQQAIKDLGLDTKLICFDDGEHSMKRFIQEYDDGDSGADFEPVDFDLDKIYGWLLSTSGSTGAIKLAAFTHRTFFKKLIELKPLMKSFPFGGIDNIQHVKPTSILNTSPVQWVGAMFGALTYPVMRMTKVLTSAPCTPDHVIDIINEYKPAIAYMGPSIVAGVLRSEKHCDFSCLAAISLAGAKTNEKILLQLRENLRPGAIMSEVYGQTENLAPVLCPNPSGPLGNCGKCLLEWQNVKLVDPETGIEITKPHMPGEMWTKVTCFSEYYNNPKETAAAFTEDGWYRTGDILYRDEEGNYFFVERLKMLIKYRNYHIVPSEIEAVIMEHPGVSDVSVTSIPHEEDGEHPVACVVRKKGSNVTAQEIKDLVASDRSDSQKLRGGVVFLDEIPLTSTGKIARGKLKQIALTAHRE